MQEDITRQTLRVVKKSLQSLRNAIFTKSDLQEIVLQNLPDVGPNQRALIRGEILEYLWETGKLKEATFDFPSRRETRYLLGKITNFQLAQALKPNAYLAHRAAMFLTGLCDEAPETIHINVEQSQHHKRNTNTLTQGGIDQAFRNKTRVSNEVAEANGIKVCITHGQRTDQLGVETKKGANGELLFVTNLERTLIDITVRPIYVGGPKEVLKAYKKARHLSSKKLFDMLKKMDFVYPYHQAIGFYLDASGAYSATDLLPFKKIKRDFDFYLDYRMTNPVYSSEWQIYYPAGL